jgi:hypothetical protein
MNFEDVSTVPKPQLDNKWSNINGSQVLDGKNSQPTPAKDV